MGSNTGERAAGTVFVNAYIKLETGRHGNGNPSADGFVAIWRQTATQSIVGLVDFAKHSEIAQPRLLIREKKTASNFLDADENGEEDSRYLG
jgi:hypothetical protein